MINRPLVGALILCASVSVAMAECGKASWYGPGFHGRTTACGQRYDQHGISAAHRSLPCGTRLTVTDQGTGRKVSVQVTDRGPFIGGRIIDLSRGAAAALGMVGRGIANVCISKGAR